MHVFNSKSNLRYFVWAIVGLFLFTLRFFVGQSKFYSNDEFQSYLIGLKSVANDIYPYLGADVFDGTSRIIGGMHGLMISIPLRIFQAPEAPYLFVNILSFFAISFFGWYLSKRFLSIPIWFTYLTPFILPWTMYYSTNVMNPSYILFGSILFFVSVIELGNFYKNKLIHPSILFLILGFSTLWILQFHLSWVLLLPYIAWVFYLNRKNTLHYLIFFLIGSLISFSTLIPTIWEGYLNSGTSSNVVLNLQNILLFPLMIVRFFSFASFEVVRFIGVNTQSRIEFLLNNFWAAPFIIFLVIIGIIQVGIFLYLLVNPLIQKSEWNKVRKFIFSTFLLLLVAFTFSKSEPKSHTFYLLIPISIWYSFYCYEYIKLFKYKWVIFFSLISGIVLQIAIVINRSDKISLYSKRDLVYRAIMEKDYTLLGIRRISETNRIEIKQFSEKNYVNDTLIIKNGFEVTNDYDKPQNIVKTFFKKGEYSLKVDSIQIYGNAIEISFDSLQNSNYVRINFWAKSQNPENFYLVEKIESSKSSFSKYNSIDGQFSNEKNWYKVSLDLPVNINHSSLGTIKYFFWMHKKSSSYLYIDDLNFKFYNKIKNQHI